MAMAELAPSRHRLYAALTAVAGIVALTVTVAFRLLPQVKDAAACVPADGMLRFEFARTPADLAAIFGACRPQAIAAMDAMNHLDVEAYIPSYPTFAALAAVVLARSHRRPLVIAAVLAAATAMIADFVETFTLLRITQNLDAAAPLLATSSTAAWIKFAALGLNAGLLSAICLTASPPRRILGTLLILPAVATIVMTVDPTRSALLTYAYLLSWVPVLAIAIREAVLPNTQPRN
jgi:hypothetical protein